MTKPQETEREGFRAQGARRGPGSSGRVGKRPIPIVAVGFQLLEWGDMDFVGPILLPSLLHQPKLPPAEAVQPRHLAAEIRQEESPLPRSGWSDLSAAASPGPHCHGQLKAVGPRVLHLYEVDVSPTPGITETSGTWLWLPASGWDALLTGHAALSPLAMERKLQCNLMKY